MNISITGGSGFIGSALTKKLLEEGHSVTIYDKIPPLFNHELVTFIKSDFAQFGVPDSIAQSDAIVHLAGVSIYNRWTPAYKQLIISSRIDSMRSIVRACEQVDKKPQVLVCASAIGIYGDQGDAVVDESGASGNDFLSSVCNQWEQAAAEIEALGIRRVSVRTAIVLGPNGGMMQKIIPLFRYGLGGRLGNGNQWFSWIHIDDLVAIYYEAITNKNITGPVNACAPEPVSNRVFTKTVAKTFHRFAPWIIPEFILGLVLGEFSRAVLTSTRAIPKKLLKEGFIFNYPTIIDACKKIFI